MDCYGRRYGRLETCAACNLAVYCKDAADLPAGSQRLFEESAMEDVDLELLPSVDAAPFDEEEAPQEEEGEDMAQAQLFKEALVKLSQMADGSDTRLGILIDRVAGLSYEAIAGKRGMTKQGVEKHLRAIRADSPELFSYLLKIAGRLPIAAVETGSDLGLVDSDRKPARKGYSKKTARQSQDDRASMLPL